MTLKIAEVDASYRSVKIELRTSSGERFFAILSEEGIAFMSDESSSGALSGTPLLKSADDLLNWIGLEGTRKPFRERAQVRAKAKR
ncbi:hypothetical protein J2W22_001164 [Sphingomonas kyeonggiensis]|uniref:hypothetical protein n=1 Tax=Sphingomonas kyeonggiensis TaxID=1268553 RepID=UPI00278506A0|nr:hypothetical protein [Sphingomonas kyeonggiensis]MDQ0249117.1 hypothetical protein [Sphingomonas kyeonggiensis]